MEKQSQAASSTTLSSPSPMPQLREVADNAGPSQKKSYVCSFCEKSFCRRDYLKKHVKTQHPGEYKTLFSSDDDAVRNFVRNPQTLCRYFKRFIFINENHESDKQQSGQDNTDENIPPRHSKSPSMCEICQQAITRKDNIKSHMKLKHPQEYQINYNSNIAEIANGDVQKALTVTPSGPSTKFPSRLPTTCSICKEVVSRADYLKRHFKNIHPQEYLTLYAGGTSENNSDMREVESDSSFTVARARRPGKTPERRRGKKTYRRSPTGVTPKGKKSKQGKRQPDFNLNGLLEVLKEEFQLFTKQKALMCHVIPNMEKVQEFSFHVVSDFLKRKCPNLFKIFAALSKDGITIDIPVLVSLCTMAFNKNLQSNMLQRLIAFHLWRGGLKTLAMDTISQLGLCLGTDATLRQADKFSDDCLKNILRWKSEFESHFGPLEAETSKSRPEVSTSVVRSLQYEEEENSPKSYAFVFDNLNIVKICRHQGPFTPNKVVNGTVGYVFKNRVISPNTKYENTVAGNHAEIPMEQFYLGKQELNMLFRERVEVFKKLAVEHISYFGNEIFIAKANSGKHEYFQQSKEKSQTQLTGFVDENEATVVGVCNILDNLNTMVGKVNNNKVPCVVHGDGMTIDRVKSAVQLRSFSVDEDSKLNHFYTCNGDWHTGYKMVEKYGACFELLPEHNSSVGSLQHIKQVMGHRQAGQAKCDYNHDFDLAREVVHDLGTLLLTKVLKIKSVDDIPDLAPSYEDKERCMSYLEDIATASANFCNLYDLFYYPNKNMLYCKCQTSNLKDPTMRKCDNTLCRKGTFFHLQCVNGGLPEGRTKIKGKWYCSATCADRIFQHTIAMLADSISHYVRKEAIRHNNGPMMYLHYKENLYRFFLEGNHNYTKHCHDLILSQNNCVPPNVALDMIWNRTVNYTGEFNNNIETDLACEFIVRDTKEQLNELPGNWEDVSIRRRSLSYSAAKAVDEIFRANLGVKSKIRKKEEISLVESTKVFLESYKSSALLDVAQGPNGESRYHDNMIDLDYMPFIKDPKSFEHKMKGLNSVKKLDFDISTHFTYDVGGDSVSQDKIYTLPNHIDYRYQWLRSTSKFPKHSCYTNICTYFPTLVHPDDTQIEIIDLMVKGTDVICALPCGYGKSNIFVLASVFKYLTKSADATVVSIVVSPLDSLIEDQISHLQRIGLQAYHCSLSNITEIDKALASAVTGSAQVHRLRNVIYVYCSPELLARPLMRQSIKNWNVDFLIVDECHLVLSWGQEFRPDFHLIGEVRAHLQTATVGAFTATLTDEVVTSLVTNLALTSRFEVFFAGPDRPNIYIAHRNGKLKREFFKSLVASIKLHGIHFRKTIIYVDTYTDVLSVQRSIMSELKGDAYIENKREVKSCLVMTYFAAHSNATKKYIEETFRLPTSPIRVLISTVAFGLGINIPDIEVVIHMKMNFENDVFQFWQDGGRSGRNGRQALSLSFGNESKGCYRSKIMSAFTVADETVSANFLALQSTYLEVEYCKGDCQKCLCVLCTCCDSCAAECKCRGKSDFVKTFFPEWELQLKSKKVRLNIC